MPTPNPQRKLGAKTGRAADPFNAELGARIRACRLLAGLTQVEVAAALGVTFQQLQKYESGSNRIPAPRLPRLAGALGVPVAELLTGAGGSSAGILAIKSHKGDPPGHPGANARLSLELMKAFARIKDLHQRKHLLALARAMANAGERDEQAARPSTR